jgi:dihydrofolate reductase
MPVRISLVAAVAENNVIGCGGDMPWRLPTDLARFRALTLGKPVVMGRKTYLSLGRPLPGRDNVVVTRDPGFAAEGVRVAHSVREALRIAAALAAEHGGDEAFVIGGGETYAAALPFAGRIYLTRVHARPEGDTWFPALDPRAWQEIGRETVPAGERDTAAMTFLILERAGPSSASIETAWADAYNR